MRSTTLACSMAFLIIMTGSAHAYLDPGTGSIILQAMIAAVASSLVVVKMYWYKLKALLGFGPAADETEEDTGIQQ